MHLIHIKLEGYDLPEDLPEHLIPPSKKRYELVSSALPRNFYSIASRLCTLEISRRYTIEISR